MTLAVKLDGEKYKEEGFPSKEGHIFKGYDCGDNKEVNVVWDKNTWSASLSNIKTKTTCILEFETTDNLNLNGSEPVVKEGLVPVVIANDGTVTKTETDDINWYDYNESKWANAVILTGTDTYGIGQTIPEEAIKAYFVWIPKYRYKLKSINTNNTTPSELEIEIKSKDTVNSDTECIAPNKSGETGSCEVGKWMTHPAFISLGSNVTGIWIGKFETTGSTSVPTIKPNVASLRSVTGKVMYDTAWNFSRNLDSHMMKNTEWGAFVYLTNSKYGRPKDDNGVPTEVWINNSSTYTTGCAGSSASASNYSGCQNAWNTSNGYHASTTNNISGIYDTSGGAWDMVMGNLNNTPSRSGFTGFPDSKYYNKYTGTDSSARILGDAFQETYGWNEDFIRFVSSSSPWFVRGGSCINKTTAGVFSIGYNDGGAYDYLSFRIVLCPTV